MYQVKGLWGQCVSGKGSGDSVSGKGSGDSVYQVKGLGTVCIR